MYRLLLAFASTILLGILPAAGQSAPSMRVLPEPGITIHSARLHSTPVPSTWLHSTSIHSTRLHSTVHSTLLHGGAESNGGTGVWKRRLAVAQGGYFLATGLWPILHMDSFERVTGPKTDDWLVKTVGALVAVTGGTLLMSGLEDGPSTELQMVAAGTAGALAVIDVTYVAQGRISRIYLLDAVLEVAIVGAWLLL